MDITFANAKIRKLCEQQSVAVKKLGQDCARKLRARLSDIRAATSVWELKVGNPHPLIGDRKGQFALNLKGGRRLVFEPASDSIPRKEDGGINWEKVSKVCIVFIGDYHD